MYGADEGNSQVGSYKSFINYNIQGYYGSISAEVGSVMCSYSAINLLPLSMSPYINTLLRRKMKFDGFVISDYDEIARLKDQQLPTYLSTFG
jgi:beta-glucosidase